MAKQNSIAEKLRAEVASLREELAQRSAELANAAAENAEAIAERDQLREILAISGDPRLPERLRELIRRFDIVVREARNNAEKVDLFVKDLDNILRLGV